MLPYWITLAFALCVLRLSQRSDVVTGRTIYARWGVALSAGAFIFMTGFRYGVGQDYFYTYVPYFEKVCAGQAPADVEFGFYAINKLVSLFTTDPTPVFLICSIVFFVCTYAAIMRSSPHPVLSIFLLVGMAHLFVFMNAMRQLTAVSILLFSVRYIEERKPLRFAAALLAACSLHTSALLFAVAYFFPKLEITLPLCVGVVVGCALFKAPLADALLYVVSHTKYAEYIGSRFDTGQMGYVVAAINVVVLLFSAAVPCYYKKEIGGVYRILLWCQLVCAAVSIMAGAIPLAQRVRWVFSLPSVILLPMALDSIEDKRLRFVATLGVVVLYVAYVAITIGIRNGNNVLPYQNVLF